MKDIVVVPTYNESENIKLFLENIFINFPEISILVVDGNSPDGTANIVDNLKSEYENLFLLQEPEKRGLGMAYLEGFQYILKNNLFQKIIMMDADFSHDSKYLDEFLKYDLNTVVVGSRYVVGGQVKGWEVWRKLLSKFGNIYARIVTRLPVTDLTGGYNVVPVSLLKKIDFQSISSSGYAFQIELKYLLYKSGAKFLELPIVFKNRINGESKITNHIIAEGVLAPWKIRFK